MNTKIKKEGGREREREREGMTELNYYKLKTYIVHFTILDKFFGKLSPEVPGSVGLGYIVKLDEIRFKHRTIGESPSSTYV